MAHKGQDILLQAMPKVVSKVPDAKLWIAGAGADLAKLRGLTNKLKIGRSVEFKGPVYGATKWSYLKNCRLLCVPPRTESFGIIYLEAMAYGLPTVTSNVGGIPEVVGDSAILVPPNDPSALADALIQVLTDQKLADNLREKGLERVKRFDWEVFSQKIRKTLRATGVKKQLIVKLKAWEIDHFCVFFYILSLGQIIRRYQLFFNRKGKEFSFLRLRKTLLPHL